MVKTLTKAKAIEEHRKMWEWIANFIDGSERGYITVRSYYDIAELKRKYMNENFQGKIVRNNCFLCAYDSRHGTCDHCPVDFSHITYNTNACLNGLYNKEYEAYDKFLDNPTRENAKAAAELCRQIAHLPERKNLPGDLLYTEEQAKEFYHKLREKVYGDASIHCQGIMSIELIADHMKISVERATEFCDAMLLYGITERSNGMIVV